MTTPSDPLPADLAAAHAMILTQREQLTPASSEVTVGRLEIEWLKLMLEGTARTVRAILRTRQAAGRAT